MPGHDITLDWLLRYTAPRVGLPRWSTERPERLAFISSESGIGQAWAGCQTGVWTASCADRSLDLPPGPSP